MISAQPAIPLLVHEDCMDSIKTDLADQQASLSNIANNTESANSSLSILEEMVNDTRMNTEQIIEDTSSIRVSSSNTATATSSLYSSVGTTADASTENTVIGLLKSISNKITTF